MVPAWLRILAFVYITVAVICAFIVLYDIFGAGHRQKMKVMEAVWPITMLSCPPPGGKSRRLICRRAGPYRRVPVEGETPERYVPRRATVTMPEIGAGDCRIAILAGEPGRHCAAGIVTASVKCRGEVEGSQTACSMH